jgi:hypothetical protein
VLYLLHCAALAALAASAQLHCQSILVELQLEMEPELELELDLEN